MFIRPAKILHHLSIVAGIGALLAGPAMAQLLANRPFLQSPDKKLSASFDGGQCGEQVAFIFRATQPNAFADGSVARSLMTAVVQATWRSCPTAKLVAAKGVNGDRVVYNAVAEASTGWQLLELGSAREASLLAGGARGTSADRSNFLKRRDFSPFGTVLAAMKGKPYLCTSPRGMTCTSASEFRNASEDGATLVARSLLDGAGTQAVLTYAATNRSGMLCSNPQQAKIDVVGGNGSPAARARMAADLRERLKPYGDQVCSGYSVRGSQILSANFDANGARVGEEVLLTATAAAPQLRQDR